MLTLCKIISVIVSKKVDVISRLQMDILRLQGLNSLSGKAVSIGLGEIENAFPNASFPLGAVHEFLSAHAENISSTNGFVAGLLSSLMGSQGAALWISSSRKVFPPALKSFGIEPDRIIFIDLQKEKEVMWAMDEALKCSALSVVVGEMSEISFTSSRRLQLAVEKSHVTGFILRNQYRNLTTTACVSRWKITSLPSESVDGLPGIGYPRWRVELSRVRNGKPGVWEVAWINGRFVHVSKLSPALLIGDALTMGQRKTG